MSSNDVVVAVRGISKSYTIAHQAPSEDASPESAAGTSRKMRWQRPRKETFWALRDVSFDVQRGDVVGIIGRNGAGKSTLLKILSRITAPTTGGIDVYGRIGSLLEVGTGFHPELTGRENVFLNGSILGMRRREIEDQFDAIVDFSGVEQFLDTPVKRYSSGMYVRLAFAVAAHLNPEILVVDEVLAVGDAAFQKKCLGKMTEVAKAGRTVLFVSHNMGSMSQLCRSGILLERGQVIDCGEIRGLISQYLTNTADETGCAQTFPQDASKPLQVRSIAITNDAGVPTSLFNIGSPITITIECQAHTTVRGANIAVILYYNGSELLCSFDTDSNPDALDSRNAGTYNYTVPLPVDLLKAGTYTVEIATGFIGMAAIEDHKEAVSFTIEELLDNTSHKGYGPNRPGVLRLPLQWETTSRQESP